MNSLSHLYLHVPFCDQICAYCDFYRSKSNLKLMKAWMEQIKKDLASLPVPGELVTLYIGGGTPTALPDDLFEQLLLVLQPLLQKVEEFTIEANPESLSQKKLELMHQYGVNRISLGVQTFKPSLQKLIKRSENIDFIHLIEMIHQAGIHNISIDMMYGLPTQTEIDFQQDLQQAFALDIQHLSIYSLTIEEGSLFGRQHQVVDSEVEANCYQIAIEACKAHGFEHYEVSSFAKPNAYSKHNLAYWTYQDFYGIGPGASGKKGAIRYTNEPRIDLYIKGKRNHEEEYLELEDQMFETIMMGLRTTFGFSISAFNTKFSVDFRALYADAINKNEALGYLQMKNDQMAITERGMIVLHDILLDFMED